MTRHLPLSELATPRGLVGGPFGSSLVSNDYVDVGIPVVRGTNLGFGRYVGGEFARVTAEKFESDLARNSAVAGDVVFTQRGTLGQVALVPLSFDGPLVISQSQMRLRVDPTVADSDFVYYACSTAAFKKQIDDNAISTGVPHINLGILSRLTVALPSLAEQRAIAEVLGALDDKIAANLRLVKSSESFAVASLSTVTKTVPLGEVANLLKRTVNPASLGTSFVEHYSLPAFDQSGMPARESPAEIKSNKFLLDRPVVLLSKLNPRFPRVWNVSDLGDWPALSSTEFLVLEPSVSTNGVLWAAISQPEFASALGAKVSGTSGSHQRVKPADALATFVIDPRALSDDRANVVTNCLDIAFAARQENLTLAATRDALLPQLMSGKLRVKDAENQISEVV